MKLSQATVVTVLAATAIAGKLPKKAATTDCEKVRSDCQAQPDPNESYCAALYAECAGSTSGLNKPYPSATAAPNATWVTETVTNYLTYCPESTTFKVGQVTYNATESQWVAVTDCPNSCTISWKPNATSTICPGTVIPVAKPTQASNGTYNIPAVATPSSESGSHSGNTGAGSGSGENTPATFTGAGTKLSSSAALVALVGAFIYLL